MDIALLTCIILAVGVCISAVEDCTLERRLFKQDLFDWRYCLVFQPILRPSHASPIWDYAFGVTAFKTSAVLRIVSISGAGGLLWNDSELALYAVLICLVCYLYLFYRFPYSLDGSDQMCMFVLIGLSVMCLDSGDGRFLRLGALAILLHASIAYITSGLAKLVSPIWRSGGALSGVMSCGEFGNAYMATLLADRPKLSRG